MNRPNSQPYCATCYEKRFKHEPKNWYFVGYEACADCGTETSVCYADPGPYSGRRRPAVDPLESPCSECGAQNGSPCVGLRGERRWMPLKTFHRSRKSSPKT